MKCRKTKKSSRRNTVRKVTCRNLIPLDTAKIRKELLKVYKRRKKVLEKIEVQLEQYNENDEPEFQKFIARRFGAEQTRLRELAEQITLAQFRHEKLRYMAREEGISQRNYCAYLESQVTPETDFWAVLENEIRKMQEEQRRWDEEFEQYCRECDEADGVINDDDDYDEDFDDDEIFFDDDELEDDFSGFADEIEDIFGKDARSIFDNIFEGILPAEKDRPRNNEKDLKKLYRELCLRYHPDKIGKHDVKTRRLWFSIQEAYNVGDLYRLRSIHAGIEIESGNTGLFCSEIDNLLGDIEWSIQMTRNELRMKKKAPYWGFAGWTEKQRRKAEQELTEEFRYEIEMTERELQKCENQITRIRNSSQSKKKKQKFDPELQPDLFQTEIPF